MIGTHRTATLATELGWKVIYHNTCVVDIEGNNVVLNTGGWKTRTTKRRMNQASAFFDLGYTVYQKDFAWYVDYRGEILSFDENGLCRLER